MTTLINILVIVSKAILLTFYHLSKRFFSNRFRSIGPIFDFVKVITIATALIVVMMNLGKVPISDKKKLKSLWP